MRAWNLCLLMGGVMLFAAGCGGGVSTNSSPGDKSPVGDKSVFEGFAKDGAVEAPSIKSDDGKSVFSGFMKKSDKGKSEGRPKSKGDGSVDVAKAPPKKKAAPPKPKPAQPAPQSGILTAGSFDDNRHPQALTKLLTKLGQSQKSGSLPSKLLGRRITFFVKGKDGDPMGNASVRIANQQGQSVHLVTRSDGRAIFLSTWDGLNGRENLKVTVTSPDGAKKATRDVGPMGSTVTVEFPNVQAPLPVNLDLALVLDATGSMGDEMNYLKAEIKSIAAAVHTKFPHVKQRYSLILYRDHGDIFDAKRFDFTDSVDDFRKNLSDHRADGGGDYLEAVHRGLEEAVQLRWRRDKTARVLFLVGDAPPHAQHLNKTLEAANALRKKGVAIYPIACSGYGIEMELVMRSCALLTGSQFLFLTDDSGVGNSHEEPHIPFYHVQRLDHMMIRMISSELAGRNIPPLRDRIIRTSGNVPMQ